LKVTVNDREMLFGEEMTQSETIVQLQSALKENNLVIMEAEVNGVKSSINLAEIAGLNDIDTLSLVVGTPGQVITDGLETAVTYLPVLQSGLTDIAAFLQEGREGEGISKFLQVVPGLEWLGQILSGAELILEDTTSKDSFKACAAGYGKKLEELLDGWQNRDYVLIADLLEYELAPFIQELVPLIQDTLSIITEKE